VSNYRGNSQRQYPVNGDAECIVSMSCKTKMLQILDTATVEQPVIKKEIYEVMEGGERVFDMRYKK